MTDVPVYRAGAGGRAALQRALDCVGAAVGLTLGLPALALLAAGVRWSAGPRVLHAQWRVGRGGKRFLLYKFRTLPLGASARADYEWSVRCEHPFLAWMRRTGLDEAPQLWNVLRGEMSLVGPRPERPFFVDKFSRELPHYRRRLAVRPGITGLAQVEGLRGDTSIERRLEMDLDYVRRQSLWLDLRILVRTVLGLKQQQAWPTRSTSSSF